MKYSLYQDLIVAVLAGDSVTFVKALHATQSVPSALRHLLYFIRDLLLIKCSSDSVPNDLLCGNATDIKALWRAIATLKQIEKEDLFRVFGAVAEFAPAESPADLLVRLEVRIMKEKEVKTDM